METTPSAAKKIIASALLSVGCFPHKLTARTVSFVDLARDNCVFVKIHNWKPSEKWAYLENKAKENGFRIE